MHLRTTLVGIYCSSRRNSSTLGWYSRVMEGRTRLLMKQTQFCVTFTVWLSQNRSFQTPQSCQFLNRSLFRSSPMVMKL